MRISSPIFDAFIKCATKCHLRSLGEVGSGNEYAEWVRGRDESYGREAARLLQEAVPEAERVVAPPATENLKAAKWRLAVDLVAQTPDSPDGHGRESQPNEGTPERGAACSEHLLESRIHAIERVPSEGWGKPAQFVPIRFMFRNKLTKDDRLLLAFDAVVLSQVLGREVSLGKIIHGDDHATLKVKTSALVGEVRKRLEKLAILLSNSAPPDLVLNRHCAECEFQARCRKIAIEKDDLSLLASMSAKERNKLRSKGIFTVTQLSYTFRPRRRPKGLRNRREKYHHSLKALAIRDKKIHIVGSPELKIEGTPVYLDVEGLPDREFYYLIGARMGNGESAVQHSLWADTVEDEGKIWREFLTILESVEKPVLIHYGSYETNFLKQMKIRYNSPLESSLAAKAIDAALNVVSVVFASIYFPTFSNGLKEIGRYLGFEWSETDASGVASVAWRHEWESSLSAELKQRLVTYNTDDCASLARLKDRLSDLSSKEGDNSRFAGIVHAGSLPCDFPHIFKANQFQFPEFEQINRAAYWNYQREKVLVKSSAGLKKIARQAKKMKCVKPRVNKTVDWPEPVACPRCGRTTLYRHQAAKKTVMDLRFSSGGVKRWTTTYRFYYYRCPACRKVFFNSERAWNGEKFGPTLQAFCIYQNIEMRLPQHQIAAFLNVITGLPLSFAIVHKFKESAAAYYRHTYEALLGSIVSGSLVHADETKVNLGVYVGYVWVFANLHQVAYLHAPSREGDLPQRLLKDFKGVLVSDFYAAYDSLNCPQQKCLVHLIRDLNDELYKQPFNAEFKELVGEVANLLKPMIETVDRFGLKARFLRKHNVDVDRFFTRLSRREFQTEAAVNCKKRLERKRETLFTFLNHDGVPWNNNNAEHAIKAFVLLRRDFDGLSTEKGIKEYLVLLSVCQTCKYMGVSFLDFLRSGEKHIRAFADSRRERRRRTQANQTIGLAPGGGGEMSRLASACPAVVAT
jgi:predicted RecB family nuclease